MSIEHAGERVELSNTLGSAASAYLRTAAHQPIAWQQWGPEAFDLAQRLDRPVLLDVGAVWCHWCHVMDHESYENAEVARLINENFIAIKVDRDERPDVDGRYQRLVQALSQGQGGGWPLTGFLTPDGHVFSGGTYFPREDKYGRRGMLSLLPMVARAYHERNIRNEPQIVEINREVLRAGEERLAPGELSTRWLDMALTAMAYEYEEMHGGFGTPQGPKFPAASAVEFLLRMHAESGSAEARRMALGTLDAMMNGGVHDQIAGGFHRYSVDGRWIVPHFEKMLYDNAGLLTNCAHAFAETGDARYREAAAGIIDFAVNVLEQPEGGFGGSQDADVGPEDDGDFYTWTLEEARACLSAEEFEAAAMRWDIQERGEMHHNEAKNVLWRAASVEAIAERTGVSVEEAQARLEIAQEKMLAARLERPAPFIDPTIYVSWNGMMIQALVEASRFTGDERALEAALRAVRRLERDCWREGRGWTHTLAEDGTTSGGYADDQAQMALALLGLHQVTADAHWRDLGLETLTVLNEHYWDESVKSFRDTPRHAEGDVDALDVPSFQFVDQPTPAANPSAALAMVMAAVVVGGGDTDEHGRARTNTDARTGSDIDWHARAEETMRAVAGDDPRRYGHMIGTAAQAMGALLWTTPSVVIVGDAEDERTVALREAALGTWRPGLVVVNGSDATNGTYVTGTDGQPLAYVCAGRACAPPVSEAARLPEVIRTFRR